jgi:hypothetical protein
MKTCGDLDLVGYLKAELAPGDHSRAKAHLSLCESCHSESERLRGILRVLQTEEWIEPGPKFTDRVVAAFDAMQAEEAAEPERETEPVISSIGHFLRVLGGRARGTMPAWAISVAVHLFLFGALALIIYTQMRDDDADLVVLIGRTREPGFQWEPVPKGIPSPAIGQGPAPRETGESGAPDFDKDRRGADRDLPGPIAIPKPPREEEDRRQKMFEYQRRWDAAGWYGGASRADRDRLFDPTGKYRAAVNKALRHLAGGQSDSGLWEAPPGQAKAYEVGVTGLALMAFAANGSTHREGPFAGVIERGINGLRARQRGGLIGAAEGNYMYNHAIATIALLEVYLRSGKDPDLRVACHEAVEFLVLAQNETGGWRYQKEDRIADLSVTVWVLQALRTAVLADFRDLAVGALIRARRTLDALRLPDGRYLYGVGFPQGEGRLNDPSWWTTRLAMGTYATLLCTQAIDRTQIEAHARSLLETPLIHPEAEKNDWCRLYYGSLTMFQLSSEPFARWWNVVAPEVAALQAADGSFPRGFDKWSLEGGPAYSTAMAALVLQTHHRFPSLH